MRRLVAIAAVAAVFLFLLPAALAAEPTDPALAHTGRVLISTGGDITLPAGDQADAVIVVDGTATIEGTVNTVVVVDGSATLTGARTETVVAVRSPVTLGEDTVVLGDVLKLDSLITKQGNADVQGEMRDIWADVAGIGFFLGPIVVFAFLGFALAAVAAGLLLAGLAARQVRAAEELISREPIQTLIAAFVGLIVPILAIVFLFVTIVGVPLALGIMLGLWPLAAFVGYLVAAIWVGEWVLRRTSPATTRERPYLAAVLGVLILQVLAIWPFLSMIASLFGYGAVVLLAWRTWRGSGHGAIAAPRTMPAPMPS